MLPGVKRTDREGSIKSFKAWTETVKLRSTVATFDFFQHNKSISVPRCPPKNVTRQYKFYHKANTSGVNWQEEVTSGSQFLVPELAEVDLVEFYHILSLSFSHYPSHSLMTFVL